MRDLVSPFLAFFRRPAAHAPEHSARRAPRHAPVSARMPSLLLAAPAPPVTALRPSFEAKRPRPDAATAPHPVADARPHVQDSLDPGAPVWPGSKPVIGESLAAPAAEPEHAETAEPGNTALLYTEPGWAALQMSRWVTNGEWEPLHPIVRQGWERNAADMAVSITRNRARIADAAASVTASIERPDLTGILLRRAHELTMAARAAAMTAGAR
jgi:hypothetical protein